MLILSRGHRKISVVPDHVWFGHVSRGTLIIVQILSGKFKKTVDGRNRVEKNALQRVYRLSSHSIEIKLEQDVYVDAKKLLRKSDWIR